MANNGIVIDDELLDDDQWACEKCTYINSTRDLTCIMCYEVRTSAKDIQVHWQWQAEEKWIPYDLPSTIEIEEALIKQNKTVINLTKGYFLDNPGYKIEKKGKDRYIQINNATGNRRAVRRIAEDDDKLFKKIDRKLIRDDDQCGVCQDLLMNKKNGGENNENNDDEEEGEDNESIKKLIEQTRLAAEKLIKNAKAANGEGSSTSSHHSSIENNDNDRKANKKETTTTITNTNKKNEKKSKKEIDSTMDIDPDIVKLPKCTNHYFHRQCIASWLKLKDHCPSCRTKI